MTNGWNFEGRLFLIISHSKNCVEPRTSNEHRNLKKSSEIFSSFHICITKRCAEMFYFPLFPPAGPLWWKQLPSHNDPVTGELYRHITIIKKIMFSL